MLRGPAPEGFADHLRAAIRLNLDRRDRYAALSGGRSRAVSDRLIYAERLLLPVARAFDALARPYQRRGVGLMVDEFVPMELAPAFAERLATVPRVADAVLPRRGARRLAQRTCATFLHGGFEALAEALTAELEALAATPSPHAMTRHVLESARRAARLAPQHARAAAAHGLPSPAWITGPFVLGHLLLIPAAARLDRLAAPLQCAGLPILLHDLPSIPDAV